MSLRPLAPWQAAQTVAKRWAYSAAPALATAAGADAGAAVRLAGPLAPRAGRLCACTAVATTRVAARASTNGACRRRVARLLLAAVADAIDRSGMVVAHQQRAVLHDVEINRPPEVGVVLDEAGHELLDLRAALAVGPGDVHAVVLLGPIPRAVLGDEHRPLVFRREHLAGVELQAERAGVRPQQRGGLHIVVAGLAPAELRIGDVALMAVREAEVLLARLGDDVELVVRQFFAEPVAAVVGEPEVAGLRVEVEADGVAHARGDRLDAGAVEIHPVDLGVLARVADVARPADREVELVVLDAQELPAVIV